MAANMGDTDIPSSVRNATRAAYGRLADGEVLSREEVELLGPQVVSELRAQARRNKRRLVEDEGTLRLEVPSSDLN
jgi:hypothetical protein